jgi:hypothetical protein
MVSTYLLPRDLGAAGTIWPPDLMFCNTKDERPGEQMNRSLPTDQLHRLSDGGAAVDVYSGARSRCSRSASITKAMPAAARPGGPGSAGTLGQRIRFLHLFSPPSRRCFASTARGRPPFGAAGHPPCRRRKAAVRFPGHWPKGAMANRRRDKKGPRKTSIPASAD